MVFLSALFAVASRGSLLAGSLLAAAALIGQWVGFFIPAVAPYTLLPALVFLIFVIARVLGYILSATEVDNETLCACLSGFLMIGLLWATGFTLLGQIDPKAFAFTLPGQTMDGFEAFYFSFVTLSTIGYGDITPISRVAKMLSVMEAITGMFYVAVLVARLVSIYSTPSKKAKPDVN
ncbi:MAG: potassium channel family protein [Verrucomicrobia bacterium]|nr:potassium channel family protein [Verrucomicrobiota bacterium]